MNVDRWGANVDRNLRMAAARIELQDLDGTPEEIAAGVVELIRDREETVYVEIYHMNGNYVATVGITPEGTVESSR